jgi:hypothetical protein
LLTSVIGIGGGDGGGDDDGGGSSSFFNDKINVKLSLCTL